MKKIGSKIFVVALLILLVVVLVACDEGDSKGKLPSNSGNQGDLLTYYYNNFVNDEFIEHWVAYGLNATEENKGMTCQVTLVAGDMDGDMEAEGRILYAGVAYWNPIDDENDYNYSYVSIFESEEAAKKYIKSGETILGSIGHIKRDGRAVYEETVEGNIENNIKNATVKIKSVFKKKIDFVKQAFKEIKDPKSLVFNIIGGITDSIFVNLIVRHKNSNMESTYSIYPREEGYSDQDVLRYKYETGQWYTADSFVDDTIEEGYTYFKAIDKPGFKYEFIEDENGNPTDKISVYAYRYNDASGVNMVIPSEIDGYTVEKVDTYWEVKHSRWSTGLSDLIDGNTKSVKFPRTMKEFDTYSLGLANNLTKVEIEEGNPYFTVEGNCLIRKEDNHLILAAYGAVIPSYVKLLAWSSCKSVTSIYIPIGVEYIDWNAFGFKTTKIEYEGTMQQFKEIYKDSTYPCDIICSNGTIEKVSSSEQ